MRPLLRRANGAGLNAITSNLLVVGDCATLEATLALGAVNVNHVPSRVRAPRAWLALAFPLNPLHVMRLLLDKQRYGAGMEVWLHATRCTPLHTACYLGNVGAVELLLAHGADVASAAHPDKCQPLHLAARGGHVEIVERLIAAGASAEATDARGHSARQYAAGAAGGVPQRACMRCLEGGDGEGGGEPLRPRVV